jgi:hypothetical protein
MLNEFWVYLSSGLTTEQLYNMTVFGFCGTLANFIFIIYLNVKADLELDKMKKK